MVLEHFGYGLPISPILTITAQNITIGAGGSVNGDGRGYRGASVDAGCGGTGEGLGGGGHHHLHGEGGGYGGRGGRYGWPVVSTAPWSGRQTERIRRQQRLWRWPGHVVGPRETEVDLVHLTVADTLWVDGSLSANGENGEAQGVVLVAGGSGGCCRSQPPGSPAKALSKPGAAAAPVTAAAAGASPSISPSDNHFRGALSVAAWRLRHQQRTT